MQCYNSFPFISTTEHSKACDSVARPFLRLGTVDKAHPKWHAEACLYALLTVERRAAF